MAIRIRFKGGPRAGSVQEFADAVGTITIGRNPATCQVVAAEPADTRIGREHCTLQRFGSRYRLAIPETHLVMIDGAPAMDGDELPPEATIRLGPEGAEPIELVVETLDAGALPKTAAQGPLPAGAKTRLVRVERRSRRTLGVVLASMAALALLAFALWRLRTEVGTMKVEVAKLPATIAEQTGGTLVDALNAAQRSVYLIGVRDKNDPSHFEPGGTAWSVGSNLLATNAHVARIFRGVPAGREFVARSSDTPPQDFVVHAVRIHPGYEQFQQLTRSVCPLESGLGERVREVGFINGCDVALLTVELEGRALGPALPLATDSDLAAMRPGDKLGYVGYPMEGLVAVLDPRAPRPTTQIGRVVGVVDFFNGERSDLERQLLKHSLPTAGGASGSPIFDGHGRVVALLNAGNVAGMTSQGRIPHAAMINFGQRSDLLREVLDDTAEHVQQARVERWASQLREMASCRPSDEEFWKRVGEEWARRIAPARSVDVARVTTTLSETLGEQRFAATVSIDLPAPGSYLAVALARRGVIGIEPITGEADKVDHALAVETGQLNWSAGAPLTAERAGTQRVRLFGGPAAADVELRVFGRVTQSRDEVLRDLESGFAKVLAPARLRMLTESRATLGPAPRGPGAVASFRMQMPAPGRYIVLAIASEPEDIDLEVYALPEGRRLAANGDPDWYPAVTVDLTGGEQLAVVSGERPGLEVTFRVYGGLAP